LLGDDPFGRFMALSDWLFATTGQTHQFALERLFGLVYRGLVEILGVAETATREALTEDYRNGGLKGCPAFLQPSSLTGDRNQACKTTAALTRQARHRG
jgi:hypothetical protein